MESCKKIFKNIIKNRNKIIFSLIIILLLYFFLDNTINGKKYELIKNAKDLNSKIKLLNLSTSLNEIDINNGYNLGNKRTKVDGTGVIFLEKDYSFFIGNDKMCVMKLPYSSKIMFQNEKCPNYKGLLGTKFIIQEGNEPGLYKNGKTYIYKGNVDSNYVKFENYLWRIVSINNDYIKMYCADNIVVNNSNTESILRSIENRININSENIMKIKTNGIESNYTFLNSKDIKNSFIKGNTFINNDTILYNSNFLSYKDKEISDEIIDKINPVIIIKVNNYKEGSGTKNNPFIFE